MVAYENGGFASGSVRYFSAFEARSKQKEKSTKRSFIRDIFTHVRFKDNIYICRRIKRSILFISIFNNEEKDKLPNNNGKNVKLI